MLYSKLVKFPDFLIKELNVVFKVRHILIELPVKNGFFYGVGICKLMVGRLLVLLMTRH